MRFGLAFGFGFGLAALTRDRSIAASSASLRPGGSGTPERSKISVQFISHARIDAKYVPPGKRLSRRQGLWVGQGVGTIRFVPGLPLQLQSQLHLLRGWDKLEVSQVVVPGHFPLHH